MTLSKIVCVALIALLCGCGTSPAVRYFTLESEMPPVAAPVPPAYSVVVGPVTVPELVDRPHFVLRSSPSRVEIAEYARWAAPLKSEIPRVIADHLARQLPGANVYTSAQRASATPDYRVMIDVQRFDMAPGESATVQASWSMRLPGGEAVIGRSVVSEPAGASYDELVAAHSRALGAVAKDIAGAIAKLRGGG